MKNKSVMTSLMSKVVQLDYDNFSSKTIFLPAIVR